MKQPTDEELILLYYGEADNPEALAKHLASNAADQRRFDQISESLAGLRFEDVPDVGPDYGRKVWLDLQAKLPERRRRWVMPSWFLPLVASAALLFLAFMAGRWSKPEALAPLDDGRGLLLAELGRHLEQTQFLLSDMAASRPDSFHKQAAASLVQNNRLMRIAAQQKGESELALFLDELELTLTELAANAMITNQTETELITREDHLELIFRIRVYEQKVRKRQKEIPHDMQI